MIFNKIPIFCFWHDTNYPNSIKKCINSFYENKLNDDYDIVILNMDNFHNYININDYYDFEKGYLTNTKFSDYLRFDLLSKYGGIWIDISTMILDNFDWLKKYNHSVLMNNIINMNGGELCIESWFISCQQNNKLIKMIRDELFKLKSKYEMNKFIEKINKNIRIPYNLSYDYHIVYLVMSYVIQTNRSLLNDFTILNAQDGYGFTHIKNSSNYK